MDGKYCHMFCCFLVPVRFLLFFGLVFWSNCLEFDDDQNVKSQDHNKWDGEAEGEAVENKCCLAVEDTETLMS